MRQYLLARSAQSLVVILLMSFVIYGLIGLMPGDPIDILASEDPTMTPEDVAALRALYDLDLPVYERYLNWLGRAFTGELGYSRLFGQPVLDVLGPALVSTLVLMGTAFIVAIAIAIPVGVLAASKPRSALDYGVNLFAFAGISLPSFWLALMLMTLLCVTLGWLPAGGTAPAGSGVLEQLRYMLLPVATIVIVNVGSYSRFVRASMLEVLRKDYIRTARAKGAGQWRVVWRHGLRNGMIPVVTILALEFGSLFSGALIVETIFSWPGMGKLIFDSIMGNDFNLALIALLLATVLTLLGNLLADICYAKLDPRIVIGEGR
ncbi:ABC transporter permease [Porticoccus sp. W117]|uniref:ABC transporter permease n=1 Tax=Porticoccus sp. W117 TaxID=3054777 RepID=UPI002592EA83|nr:ABC transporter permease [Porticoccus sp. W117]MDM3871038.1 ABC transporter permease [Porticoccus sp. W117]